MKQAIPNLAKPLFSLFLTLVVTGLFFLTPQHRQDLAASAKAPKHAVPPRTRSDVWEDCLPHIREAGKETNAAVERAVERICQFLHENREGAPAFAKAVLSFDSKWEYVFSDEKEYEAYLQQLFAQHLFRKEELAAVIQSSIATCVEDFQAIENRLLVRCRADVPDFEMLGLPAFRNLEALQRQFGALMSRLSGSVALETRNELGILVTSELSACLAQKVLVALSTRLGISTACLGTGGAGSLETFGVTLVIGLIVDQIVGYIYDAWADPEGKVVNVVNDSLGRILAAVQAAEGVNGQLARLAQERAQLWEQALRQLILTGGAPAGVVLLSSDAGLSHRKEVGQ